MGDFIPQTPDRRTRRSATERGGANFWCVGLRFVHNRIDKGKWSVIH